MVEYHTRNVGVEGSIPSPGLHMENRIFVGTKEDTSRFFREIKLAGGFATWNKLWEFIGISKGHFWNYYSQQLSIPENRFNQLLNILSVDRQRYFNSIIIAKNPNWGKVLGGKSTYEKHPEIFNLGRTAPKNYPNRVVFDVKQPLTTELCEFLGAFAGDGFTNKYRNQYQIGFAGDSRYDLDYYLNKIMPIAAKLFNSKTRYIRKKDNSMWVNFHSKALFEMLTQRFQLPAGIKFDKVRVPKEVLEAKSEMKAAFIRGCMDTDGCVFFDNRPTYKTPYMRLDLCMYNPTILDEIKGMLAELGIESQRLANNKHLQITSKKNVRKYFETIGSSNHRHINKVLKMYPDFERRNPAINHDLLTI